MKITIEISDTVTPQIKVSEAETKAIPLVLNEITNWQNMTGQNVFDAGPCKSAQTASLSNMQTIASSFDAGSPTHN